MIVRSRHLQRLRELLRSFPVVALLGARQVGKTTLARQLSERWNGPATSFDLEDPRDLTRVAEPMRALEGLRGLVVLDEIHRRPDLLPALRVLADRRPGRVRFLVLGSASPELLRHTSESLAGRIAHHELGGFGLDEVGAARSERLWLRGGFPRSYLARSNAEGVRWRDEFLRTFLERDLPQLGVSIPSPAMRRFWTMLAHGHGQLWNASELGRSFGVADHTVRRYLDVLVATFVVRLLLPWHENVGKRQVKAPKVYLADSGMLHSLLGLGSMQDLRDHPRSGASWEGHALWTVVGRLEARREECFFWRTHTGAELDLLVVRGRRRLGFEFKWTETPSVTKSMHAALEDLRLDHLDVIHAGRDTFPLHERVRAVSLERILEDVDPL